MKILVLENIDYCNPRISDVLRETGNVVDVANSEQTIEDNLSVEKYDYIVLDLSSETYDHADVVEICCKNTKHIPILMVLNRSKSKLISPLLDSGADDFLLRPFEISDFQDRVKALLKRNKIINTKMQEYGSLKFDVVSGYVSVNDKKLDLTQREHGVLEILFRSKGNMVSKDSIASKLFSIDDEADISSIRIYVSRLRRKIEGSGMAIRSIRGVGYALDQEN